MKLATTTWKGRNRDRLVELQEAIRNLNIRYPRVADIGVGGITYLLSFLFPEGPKKDMSRLQQIQRYLIKQIDDFLRKLSLYGSLKSYELYEVQAYLANSEPIEYLLVDRDPRILNSVETNGKVKKLEWDICQAPLPNKYDIVICYNVIQLTENPNRTLENLLDSVSPKGLLSIDTNGSPVIVRDSHFERLSNWLYHRTS